MGLRFLPYLGWAPAQAHDQFVQTLGEAGLVGAAGLCVYLVVLAWSGIRLRSISGGISLSLTMVLLLRGLTDRWYSAGATDGNLFVHFVVFAMLLLWARQRVSSTSPTVSTQAVVS
jgi:O-antigen ligase